MIPDPQNSEEQGAPKPPDPAAPVKLKGEDEALNRAARAEAKFTEYVLGAVGF